MGPHRSDWRFGDLTVRTESARKSVFCYLAQYSDKLILDRSKIRKYGRHMDKQVFFLHQQFNDFEAFCENAHRWDLDYQQLDCGNFSSELLMFGNATTLFVRSRLGRCLIQKGTSPSGLITFGLLANPGISMHWRGIDVYGDRLVIFPPGGELHGITQSDFDIFALSLSEETLNRSCHALELPEFRKLVDGNEVFNCHPQSILLLRRWLQQTASDLTNNIPAANNICMQQLEEELARHLVATLAESRGPVYKPAMRKRDMALRVAVDYIIESDSPVMSVQELCAVSNVSERTLEYAFREHFGLSPKTFTLTHRLNNVRKILRYADSDADRIHEIAGLHGFFRSGQFAADYNRLFGELPSETLRRS